MGRYYRGDIEGKFWVAVQSSDDGEYFGMRDSQNYIEYYSDDLELAEEGVKECLQILGKYKKEIDKYFTEYSSYTNEELAKTLNISVDNLTEVLEWYARLLLGNKIVACKQEQGYRLYSAKI